LLKKTVTYKNYNDEEVTETFYFHLKEDQIIELELAEGGLGERLKALTEAEDAHSIMVIVRKMMLTSYGRKTSDGKFIQNKELTDEFMSTAAWSKIFFELCMNTDKFVEFFNGIIPSDFRENVDQVNRKLTATEVRERVDARTSQVDTHPEADPTAIEAKPPEASEAEETPQVLTTREATEMDSVQLQQGLISGRYKLQ
jgi:hypothetical protein